LAGTLHGQIAPGRGRDCGTLQETKEIIMLHSLVLAAQDNPQAAHLIFKAIKGIFYLIGGVIAAIVCAIIAATKGRNPFGWGLLGFFFSILTLIVIIFIPSKRNRL
jgi:hypothetical protein